MLGWHLQNLPKKHEAMINCIHDSMVKKIFNEFSIKYLNFSLAINSKKKEQDDDSEENTIENLLLCFLKNYKFITFKIYNLDSNIMQSLETSKNSHKNDSESSNNLLSKSVDVIFCFEKTCLIIEQIEGTIVNKIIQNLEKMDISLIDTSFMFLKNQKNEENQIREEIISICKKIQEEIDHNDFVKMAIEPIASYLIRRYFYPTNYFSNYRFFDFYLNINKLNPKDRECIEFHERDFIVLRTLGSNSETTIKLVMHIESLYLFAMKKINNKEYYELAGNQIDSYIFIYIANLYLEGRYPITQDYVKAKKYYELAAKNNYPYSYSYLGYLYENGYGVERNYKKAKEYYELAAKNCDTNGYLSLGNLYKQGFGVKLNYKKAKEYYEMALELYDFHAYFYLGNLYLMGNGVKQDYSIAKQYFENSINEELQTRYAYNFISYIYKNH